MENNNNSVNLVSAFITIILTLFLVPLIGYWAYNDIIVTHFGTPAFTYWECFWLVNAVRFILGK